MIIKVHMLAFMDGEIREVKIPDDSLFVLSDVFKFGQNDFQPSMNRCSVSVGDVIDLGDQALGQERYWLIKMIGFQVMTPDEFSAYKALSKDDRRDVSWK